MYIYLTTNLINQKIYIGKSISFWLKTLDYFGSGIYLKYAIKHYGKENFKRGYQNTSREKEITENLLEIEKIYQKNINQLEKEWLLFLKNNNTIT